jgi:hypothetical protein
MHVCIYKYEELRPSGSRERLSQEALRADDNQSGILTGAQCCATGEMLKALTKCTRISHYYTEELDITHHYIHRFVKGIR